MKGCLKLDQVRKAQRHSQLLARVQRARIYFTVDIGAQVLQGTIVSKSAPLCINTHLALIPVQQLQVPHLLHVAGIGPRSLREEMLA